MNALPETAGSAGLGLALGVTVRVWGCCGSGVTTFTCGPLLDC
jgi:hypothetical protein